MKDVNKIILVGRLGADPIQRETKSGNVVVHFPLATSRRIKEEGGEGDGRSEETQWHRIVAWGRQAESCASFLRKGHAVYVEGMIRSHKYEGKDGEQRIAFEVYADQVNFLNGKRTQPAVETQAVAS